MKARFNFGIYCGLDFKLRVYRPERPLCRNISIKAELSENVRDLLGHSAQSRITPRAITARGVD
jgi:hypothetical protein